MGHIKHINVCVIRVQKGEERKGQGNISNETMAKKTSKLTKAIHLYIQKAQRTPRGINTKRSPPRYIIFKLLNTKTQRENLKAKEKNDAFDRGPIN